MDRTSLAPALPISAAADTRPRSVERWSHAAGILSTVLLPPLLYVAVQRAGCEELLCVSRLQLILDEHWLLPVAVMSTTLGLLLPGLVLASALLLKGRACLSRRCYIAIASFVVFLVLVDLDLQRSIGRHMIEVLNVALQPQGHVAGGSLAGWARMLVQWAFLAVAGVSAVAVACRELGALLTARLTPLLQRTLSIASGLLLAFLAIGPQLMRDGWRSLGLFERTYGMLLVDLRIGGSERDDTVLTDPVLRNLYPRLRTTYRDAYPTLFTGRPSDPNPVPVPAKPPS